MKINNRLKIITICTFAFFISQVSAQITLKKYSINSGGGETMKAGVYEMNASIGQVEAQAEISNCNYKLKSGFWNGINTNNENNDVIFKDSFEC